MKEIIRKILHGEYSQEELNALAIALRERKTISKYENQAEFRIGTEVIIHGISPKYFNGMEAEIVSFSPQRARVDLKIIKSTDFRIEEGSIQRGFPIGCLTDINQSVSNDVDIDAAPSEADKQNLYDFLNS